MTERRGGLLAGALFTCAEAMAAGESILADNFEGGLQCSTVAPTTLIVDALSAIVQPTFLLNGQPFSNSALQSGEFFLVPHEGEPVLLGTTFAPPPGGVRVLRGVYDVEYRWRAGDQVPRNTVARVMQGVLIDGNGPLVVDLPSTTLRGNLRMNGALFPQTGIDAATLSLQGIHALGRVVLGSTNDADYSVRLIPGAYHLRYQSPGQSGSIPRNLDALRERHDIEIDTNVRNFDIPSMVTEFQFRLNGGLFPATQVENGRLSLRTPEGDRIELGESRLQSISRRVIPSLYDGYWEGLTGANDVPANADSRFASALDIDSAIETLDVPAVKISGNFTVNGAVPPVSGTENGLVSLRDQLTGSEILLGETNFDAYQRLVIPDTYDVGYQALTGSDVMPANGHVIFERNRTIKSTGTQDIDIPVANLAWNLTLNGSPFPDTQVERGEIRSRSVRDLEDIAMGNTVPLGTEGSERLLVPGFYAPLYSRVTGSNGVPWNTRAMLAESWTVSTQQAGLQTIDVLAGSFGFTFRNNGVAFANDPDRVASFELRHREDIVYIGATNQLLGLRPLIVNVRPLSDGRTATAHYTYEKGGLTEMPQNIDTPVACYKFVLP